MKNIMMTWVLFLMTTNSHAELETINIGYAHQIQSKILTSDKTLSIYLPQSYHQSKKTYPVLYILDGQWHFSNGVAIQQALRVPDRLPEMIVVGVNINNPDRNTLMHEKRQQFLQFLEKEVLTYVDQNFRTNDDRILFGWESSAFFGNFILLSHPNLFDGVIISNGADPDDSLIKKYMTDTPEVSNYLFIANSRKDIYSIQYTDAFAKALKLHDPNQLRWKYQLFNEQEHETVPYLALYHGLYDYYHNYGSLVFSSVDDFYEKGGMSYLTDYFERRGQRFGFEITIDDSTKNSLIWLAWNSNDFKNFDLFMNAFEDVLSSKRYDSAYWQNRFGQFYLKHNQLESAEKYFLHGIKTYPQAKEQAVMHSGMAEIHHRNSEKAQAMHMMQKAIELSKDQAQLKRYQQQLSLIKNEQRL